MTICIKCLINKDNSDFYKHKQTSDWILHKCILCVKEYQKIKDNSWIDRKREKTPRRKLWKKNFLIKFRKDNPEKYKAMWLVNNFLRYHKELRPTKCFVTGKEWWLIHKHHFDYTKPNQVIPCTPKIHSDFHQWKITEVKPEWILKLPFNNRKYIKSW